ncbi:TonB-dependent receptor plug domain-containing protein [Gillisia limnaea]|uniref:TonB-dependent receptor plug n=1 Tax=Gillisia limnaea (strain DSM 15749 / LMG 21470 / R-8282) TaxID=865937 RepID=H2BWV3_GILLR|nr:TonB-dependent receptor [Gillisia limnaea]EHQ04126.1 TonB-dependent receptor plug [Gillisia limnaea DSM 15749]
MYKKLWFCGALLCTGLSFSQEMENVAVESLEEVVLIDSKFELKRENSGKVVTKITAKELEKSGGQSLPEVINRVSGIEINGTRSNDGQNLGYYIRGGRNREVVIMVDGVQLSDPSSISNDFDLRLLPLDQVASIEIIKGASSTLYGSGAAAAVINITTKEPVDKKIGLQLQSTMGTNQTQQNLDYDIAQFDNAVGLSGRLSDFNYQVNFSHRYSKNMSAVKSPDEDMEFEDDPFSKQNVYARVGYKISERLKFYFYGNFDKFSSSFDDAFMYADADNKLNSEQFRTGSHWEATYKNGSFIFSDSYSELNREIVSGFPNKYDSKVYAFDTYNKYIFNEKFHTVIGLNGIFSSFNSYNIPFGETNFEQSVSDDVASFNIVDPYVNVVYVSGFGFNLNTGTRLNIHSEYGTNLVYNVNPSYSFDLEAGYVKALASYSTAYITPSLFQLFDSNFGNRDLRPEESSTMEAGFEYQGENFSLSGIYFRRNSENFIDFVTIDPENFISEYQNISEEFTAKGVEVELNIDILENLGFSGNYTFTEAAERFALRIPKHKVNGSLNWTVNEKTFTSLRYQFNDDRTDNFFNNETFVNEVVVLESYGILDYYISHQINKNIKIFGGVTNITNEEFQEIYRFNTRGRNARFGVNLNF